MASKKAKRAGRTKLSADVIAAAAVRIADADGLDAVTIRRVAAELNARPMSLYSHIDGKDELLSLMGDSVVGEMLVEGSFPDHWRDAVTKVARETYAAFLAHPWLTSLFSQKVVFGRNSRLQADQTLRAWESLPLEAGEVWRLHAILNDYVIGHALRVASPPMSGEIAEAISPSHVAEFPELASLQERLRSHSSLERFTQGLRTILSGIEHELSVIEGANHGRPCPEGNSA